MDDDSNSGDVKQRDPPDNKSVGKGNGKSPQSSTLTKGPQPANEGLVDWKIHKIVMCWTS